MPTKSYNQNTRRVPRPSVVVGRAFLSRRAVFRVLAAVPELSTDVLVRIPTRDFSLAESSNTPCRPRTDAESYIQPCQIHPKTSNVVDQTPRQSPYGNRHNVPTWADCCHSRRSKRFQSFH